MADEAQLSQALINADKAGDVNAARILAGEIQKLRAATPVSTPETQFDDAAAHAGDYKSTLLPMRVDSEGNPSYDPTVGLMGAATRALKAPGEALAGKFDAMSPEGQDRATELATMASPLPAPMRAGERMIPGVATSFEKVRPAVPTAEALKEAAGKGYDVARNSGVEFNAGSVKDLADGIKQALDTEGRIAELAPHTHTLLGKLQSPPEGSTASLQSLDAFRQRLGDIAGDINNKQDAAAASIAIKRLDEFLNSSSPQAVVDRTAAPQTVFSVDSAGNATPGAESTSQALQAGQGSPAQSNLGNALGALNDARGNYAAAARSDKVTGVDYAADLRAGSNGSGKNIGNSLRQRLASLLLSDKQTRGLSQEEVAAAEKIVQGTVGSNVARKLANLLGGGGGLGRELTSAAGAGLGAAIGGPVGAGVGAVGLPAVGAVSKAVENALVRKQTAALDELIRSRSPLYESMKKNAPWEVNTPTGKAALVRALMASQAQEQP